MSVGTSEMRVVRPLVGGPCVDPAGWVDHLDPFRGEVVSRVGTADAAIVDAAVEAARVAQREVAAMPAVERAAVLRRAADIVEGGPTSSRDDLAADRQGAQEHAPRGRAKRVDAAGVRDRRGDAVRIRAAHDGRHGRGRAHRAVGASPCRRGGCRHAVQRPLQSRGTQARAGARGGGRGRGEARQPGCPLDLRPRRDPRGGRGAAGLRERRAGRPHDRGGAGRQPRRRDVHADRRPGGGRGGGARRGRARVVLELGGNSPNIVHLDADVERAARECAAGGFSNTGQSCNSVQRIFVHAAIAEQFTAGLVRRAEALAWAIPSTRPRTWARWSTARPQSASRAGSRRRAAEARVSCAAGPARERRSPRRSSSTLRTTSGSSATRCSAPWSSCCPTRSSTRRSRGRTHRPTVCRPPSSRPRSRSRSRLRPGSRPAACW